MTYKERWRPVVGYEEHYEVSNQGQVRSVDRRVVTSDDRRIIPVQGRILRPEIRHGYHVVNLSKGGVRAKFYVHRLVLVAFRGEPEPGAECCHYNDVRDDNRLENLRWDTHAANVGDSVIRGRHRSHNREKTHCKRGHPFDEANTVIRPTGRGCLECRRMNERARYHLRKE